VLGFASRWLDEVYDGIAKRQPEALGQSSNDEKGAEPVEIVMCEAARIFHGQLTMVR
jgi:hypothetical protein